MLNLNMGTNNPHNNYLVLKSLSILLGIFFIFLGVIKVSPILSKELHKDMRKEFVKYSKVFPLSETLGFKFPSKWYRRVSGTLEISCGAILAFVPSAQLKRGVNGVLLVQSLLSVYSHLLTDDKFERTAPALVFLFMVTCRLVVDFQAERKKLQQLQQQQQENCSNENDDTQHNKIE